MSNATDFNVSTTNKTSEDTTTRTWPNSTLPAAATTAVAHDADGDLYVIIGPALGAACALALIVIALVCWKRRRRSRKKPPPVLPNPFARINPEYRESIISEAVDSPVDAPAVVPTRSTAVSISQRQSGSSDSRKGSNAFASSVSNTWRITEKVIHSAEHNPVDERVSYIFMGGPERPISIEPPSPELLPEIRLQPRAPRQPPAACRFPNGYVNVTNETSLSPTQVSDRSTTSTSAPDGRTTTSPSAPDGRTTTSISASDGRTTTFKSAPDRRTTTSTGAPDGRTTTSTSAPDRRTPTSPRARTPEKASVPRTNFSSVDTFHLPILQTSNNHFGNTPTAVSDNDSASHSSSDSDIYVVESPYDTPTSYVNVDEFKKLSLVNEPASDRLDHSPSTSKPASDRLDHSPSTSKPASDRLDHSPSTSKPASDRLDHSPSTSKPASDRLDNSPSTSKPASDRLDNSISSSKPASDILDNSTSSSKPAGRVAPPKTAPKLKPPEIMPKPKPGQKTSANISATSGASSSNETLPARYGQPPRLANSPAGAKSDWNHSQDNIAHPTPRADLALGKTNNSRNERTTISGVPEHGPPSPTPADDDNVYQNSIQLSVPELKQSDTSNNGVDLTSEARREGNTQKHAANVQRDFGEKTRKAEAAHKTEAAQKTEAAHKPEAAHKAQAKHKAEAAQSKSVSGSPSSYLQNAKSGSNPSLEEIRSKLKKVN